jgi:uncharacterized damage-inducible protein DinB
MSNVSLDVETILQWNDETFSHWEKFFAEHPEALDFECDIMGAGTVRGLLKHITGVELRYAQRLAGVAVSTYEEMQETAEAAFARHRAAMGHYRTLLADPAQNWNEQIEFKTLTAGTILASRKKILMHATLHGIRHAAQLATLVRQHGLTPGWFMDFLDTRAME